MGLWVRTLAITAKPIASRAGESSESPSLRASMSCGRSTALRITTGLIREFLLCGEDRPFKMGGPTPPSGLSAGINLLLAIIQKDYGVAASVSYSPLKFGQAQRPIGFADEAADHVVWIEEKSGHRPVRSNVVNVRTLAGARASARNVELNELAILIAHEAVIHISFINIEDRKSTRLNSSHDQISYAVFCLKKKKKQKTRSLDCHSVI